MNKKNTFHDYSCSLWLLWYTHALLVVAAMGILRVNTYKDTGKDILTPFGQTQHMLDPELA